MTGVVALSTTGITDTNQKGKRTMNFNIGKAIKATAILFIFVSIILFAFLGGSLFGPAAGVFIGALMGLAMGWMQFILLYGFGKLIDDVHHIRQKTCGDVTPVPNAPQPAPKAPQPVAETPLLWDCPLCHRQNPLDQNVCYHCGTSSYPSGGKSSAPMIDVQPDGSWICPFCDTHNTPESTFCQNCGIEK